MRSFIQNLIITEQRSGVTFAEVEMPPLPEFPEKERLRDVIYNARLLSRPEKEKIEESGKKQEATTDEKVSFFAALKICLAARREAKAERRAIMLVYELTCSGKEMRNNVERRIRLEKIGAYNEVLNYIELNFVDDDQCPFDIAGGTSLKPVPMHKE